MASITIRFPGTPAILQASRGLFSVEAPAAYGSKGSGTPGLTILPATLPAAVVGTSYSQLLTASGGTAPYYFDIESAAPNSGRWLALPVATLIGTPQAAETSSITIRATDSNGVTATKTYSLTSAATGSLTIVTSSLPSAANNSFYAYQLLAKGGIPPYMWSWTASQPWLVTPGGWLEGTPTSTGTVTFSSVTVKDSTGASASFSPQVSVAGGSAIAGYDSTLGTLNLPPAIAGQLYSHQLVGYGTGSWVLASGVLPPGLSMSSSGLITGTPLGAGNYASSIQFGAGAVKWNPGHYAASNQTVTKVSNQWTQRKAEIDQALVNANVLGYYDFHYWNTIEDATAGTYSWTNIDQARDYIQSTYPGKRYGVAILFESFNGKIVMPAYVLSNATYGLSPNSDYGYWNLTYAGPGTVAAWWRTAISTRIQALFTAFAAHQSAGQASVGIANYDTDPYFQMVTWNESSNSLTTGSDATTANNTAQWIAINQSIVASFPHTQVVSQNNFLLGTQANTETTVHTESGNRLAAGGPDIFGASNAPANLTWGQRGYVGLDGYTSLKGFMPYVGFVQTPEYTSYTVADIGAAALGTGTNALSASEVWWTVVSGGNGDWTTNVLPFINANPVTNTAYPTGYP